MAFWTDDFGWIGLRLSGEDRAAYLHGLLTCSVADLQPGAGRAGALCSAKGRLLGDLRVFELDDALRIFCPRPSAYGVFDALSRTIVLSSSRIEREERVPGLIFGDDAARRMRAAGLEAPEEGAFCSDSARRVYATRVWGRPAWIVSGADLSSLAGPGWERVGAEKAEALRVWGGEALVGKDTDAQTLALEAGLEDRVDWKKGCFMGQETLAHIRNRGRLNRVLGGVYTKGPMQSGVEVIVSGRTLGKITSAAPAPDGPGRVGIGILKTPHPDAGARVELRGSEGTTEGEMRTLPFA